MQFLQSLLLVCATASAGSAFAVQGNYMPNADQVRDQYRAMYESQITTDANGAQRFDKARLLKYGGLNVLYLHGDQFEMAYQHGRLLKDEAIHGVIPGAAKLVYNELTNLYGSTPLIRNVAYKYIDKNFYTKLLDNSLATADDTVGKTIKLTAFGISEATGMPMNTVFDAALSPSVLMILAVNTTDSPVQLAPISNCSEFLAWGDRSADGNLIIARNTDYPLNGLYDDHHTVLYFDPTTSGSQKYMSVISAGAHNAGVVAINESGIYIGTHTIPTTEVTVEAVPAYFTANAVIAQAHTLDEAIAMFKSYRAESGWTFVVASVNENRVVSVEVNAAGVSVREAQGSYHVQTNHYLTQEKLGQNLYMNQGIRDDSKNRFARLEALVSGHAAPFNPQSAAALMADQVDLATGKVVGMPSTVAAMTTVTSVIMQPKSGRVFVATGSAPVSHNTYVELPLPGNFDMDRLAATPINSFKNDAFAQAYPDKLAAIRLFIEAKKAYEYDNDAAASRAFLTQAKALDSETGAYGLAEAAMALRDSDSVGAMDILDELLDGSSLSPHERNVCLWMRGRILADSNARSTAGADFKVIRDDPNADQKLKEAAVDALNSLRGIRRIPLNPEKMPFMFQFADFQNYKG